MKWIKVSKSLPEEELEIETKIDDDHGIRNVTNLKRKGPLWFYPDWSMYVYYTPTHWRPRLPEIQSS